MKSALPAVSMSEEQWQEWFRQTHYVETSGYHERMKALREQAKIEFEESKW